MKIPSWEPNCSWALTIAMKDSVLYVGIIPAGWRMWGVTAVTTPRPAGIVAGQAPSPAQMRSGADQVFDHHAHENLGVFKSPGKAFAVGERYARAWLKGEIAAAERCACGPIAPAKASGIRKKTKKGDKDHG